MTIPPSSSPSPAAASLAANSKAMRQRLDDLHNQLASETQRQNDSRVKAAKETAILQQIQQLTAQVDRLPEENSSPRLSTYA